MIIKKIPNQVIKEKLQPLNLGKIDSIALHHMACDNGVKDIEAMHINKGWRAIGYNYWIGFDGTIYEGRGLNIGAGVENQNGHIISIGFQGDYSKERVMSDEQFNSGIDMINWLLNKVPTIKTIGGHKDFMATACPGQYFPLKEMETLKKRSEAKMYDWVEACPDWSIPYVQKAFDLGIIKGDEQGRLGLTDDKIFTLVVVLRANGIMM